MSCVRIRNIPLGFFESHHCKNAQYHHFISGDSNNSLSLELDPEAGPIVPPSTDAHSFSRPD